MDGMKAGLVAVLAVLVAASVTVGGIILYPRGGAGTFSAGTQPKALAGSAAIVSANLSATYHSVVLVVKNTGTADLLLLGPPSVSPSGGAYCGTWGWNPTPASSHPIHPGEIVKGNCILEESTYKAGLHVTVSVAAGFGDGTSSVLSAAIIVVP